MEQDRPIIELLASLGCADAAHGAGRSLLDHLIGTAQLLDRWAQPDAIRRAGLLHSVYGTDVYRHGVCGEGDRDQIAAVAGVEAERLAHLFGTVPRRPLFDGSYVSANGLPGDPTRAELDALVILHMANLAEQAQGPGGTPGKWLVQVRRLAAHIADSDAIAGPAFTARLDGLTPTTEEELRGFYLEGRLEFVAAACPVLGEPCIALAESAAAAGDLDDARAWSAEGRARLIALGTAWDKRHSYEQWLERADLAGHAAAPGEPARQSSRRFVRYLESFAERPGGTLYPGLPATPFHDPDRFAIVADLEANFGSIRDEILALDPESFHRESEPIARDGNWDVAFLFERGRPNETILHACPTATTVIERHDTVRTLAGLTYISRLRGNTHIAAHSGPTNMRLRCHLGIVVPDGDCALRVGDTTRQWQPGRCTVFDDSFEHEAWNRTESDRIVLIVDLWHPDLGADEVRWLEAVQAYAARQGVQLTRYWRKNDAAARLAAGGLG